MKKEILGLVGILSLSGCKDVNYPTEIGNYIGVATSDSRCYTELNILQKKGRTYYGNVYSKLEFSLKAEGDSSPNVEAIYYREKWEDCIGFPKFSSGDKVRIIGGRKQGNTIIVTFPDGIVRNLSTNVRY